MCAERQHHKFVQTRLKNQEEKRKRRKQLSIRSRTLSGGHRQRGSRGNIQEYYWNISVESSLAHVRLSNSNLPSTAVSTQTRGLVKGAGFLCLGYTSSVIVYRPDYFGFQSAAGESQRAGYDKQPAVTMTAHELLAMSEYVNWYRPLSRRTPRYLFISLTGSRARYCADSVITEPLRLD